MYFSSKEIKHNDLLKATKTLQISYFKSFFTHKRLKLIVKYVLKFKYLSKKTMDNKNLNIPQNEKTISVKPIFSTPNN